MGFVSPRMSLQVWNAGSDPYDHEQLADNFLKLDQHDHSQGRGTQIPGAGIQPGAITAEHIYPGAISGGALGGDSVGTDQLQDESVTNAKLHNNARIPVGMVMDWYCATPALAATYLPDGWRICDGSSVSAGDHEIPGADPGSPFTLPNLIGKTIVGADPSVGLTLGTDAAPGVGKTGGATTHTLTQAQLPAHTHSGTTATNNVGHTHSGTTGTENTSLSHAHGHALMPARIDGTGISEIPVAVNLGGLSVPYIVGGSDWGQAGATNPDGPSAHTHSFTTGGESASHTHTFTTSSIGGDTAHNNMQPYYGLLKIMKVKNV